MIRPMEQGDIEGICALEAQIFSDAWSENSIQGLLVDEHALVMTARDKENLTGYVIFYYSAEEADLARIAVEPSQLRRGLASTMLAESIAHLKSAGIEKVFLEVRESNEPARALYEKFGFGQIDIRKKYYSNPEEDAVIMMLDISNNYR